jgi:predicted amidohydrolase
VRAACIQLTSRADKAANLENSERLVREAAGRGAELVQLPEKWNAIGDVETLHATAESLEEGESVAAMAKWARTHGIWLIGGSVTERREGREKLSNTCVVFDPDGEITAVYRKIHLFDVEVGGIVYRESEAEEPGGEPVITRVDEWTVGLSICYDLRFPDHWEVLLRARAIENTCYVAAAAQIGETRPGKPSYGRSLIADPWGLVVALAPDEEGVIVADLDRGQVEQVRQNLPSLAARRPEAYRWPVA